jgi:hypothetical protein
VYLFDVRNDIAHRTDEATDGTVDDGKSVSYAKLLKEVDTAAQIVENPAVKLLFQRMPMGDEAKREDLLNCIRDRARQK